MTSTRNPAGASLPRDLAVAVLAVAPTLCVLAAARAAGGAWLDASMLPAVLVGVLVAWSPLPISLPAVILADARDQALPQLRGPVGSVARALALVPHLAVSARSGVRAEMTASLAGLVAATAAALVVLA